MKKLLQILLFTVLTSGTASAQDNPEGPEVTIHTSKGDIRLVLYPDKAPATVANFLQYARDGYYSNTIFHRVISHFMIQGGGFTTEMVQKPTREPVKNEAANGLSNDRGTIAMARTTDPHSATAQFYINVEINANLNHTGFENSRAWGYAVFGRVIDGMDVVDEIRFVPTDARDQPLEQVIIQSVEVH